jgi:hypothetical protein
LVHVNPLLRHSPNPSAAYGGWYPRFSASAAHAGAVTIARQREREPVVWRPADE